MRHRRAALPFAPSLPVYPFHDRARKEHFLAIVREHLGRGGREVIIERGVARVAGDPACHGLTNLAQLCNQAPLDQWPRLVAEHLAKSDRKVMAAAVEGVLGGDFAAIADKLGLRIHPLSLIDGERARMLAYRVDLPGTVTALLIDLGESTMVVPQLIANLWGVPEAELFERALANVLAKSRPRWSRVRLPPSGVCSLDSLDGDFYATTHALRRDAFLPRSGEHGNLIALPTRGALLSHPLDGKPDLRAIEEYLMFTHWSFREGPGSITPHLYWRTPDGRHLLQQGSHERGRVRFAPSPEFAELLARTGSTPAGG